MKPPLPATANPANLHQFRESWLRAATAELRPYFAGAGYQVPENIRFAIAFTSTGRSGNRKSESWHASSSADNVYEVFFRADVADPVEVLTLLTKELVHTAVPDDSGHGRQFREAALKVGLLPPMRKPEPAPHLIERLRKVAQTLGPLPHDRLDITHDPLVAVNPKASPTVVPLNGQRKQSTRMLRAICHERDCAFLVRVSTVHVREIGPPHCPRHGEMAVDVPAEERVDDPPLIRMANKHSADDAARSPSPVPHPQSGITTANGPHPAQAS